MRQEIWELMQEVCSADRTPEMRAAIAAEFEAEQDALFAECAARKAERLAERHKGVGL